jgi:hypothetical protein
LKEIAFRLLLDLFEEIDSDIVRYKLKEEYIFCTSVILNLRFAGTSARPKNSLQHENDGFGKNL